MVNAQPSNGLHPEFDAEPEKSADGTGAQLPADFLKDLSRQVEKDVNGAKRDPLEAFLDKNVQGGWLVSRARQETEQRNRLGEAAKRVTQVGGSIAASVSAVGGPVFVSMDPKSAAAEELGRRPVAKSGAEAGGDQLAMANSKTVSTEEYVESTGDEEAKKIYAYSAQQAPIVRGDIKAALERNGRGTENYKSALALINRAFAWAKKNEEKRYAILPLLRVAADVQADIQSQPGRYTVEKEFLKGCKTYVGSLDRLYEKHGIARPTVAGAKDDGPEVADGGAGEDVEPEKVVEQEEIQSHALHLSGEGEYVQTNIKYPGGPVTFEVIATPESQGTLLGNWQHAGLGLEIKNGKVQFGMHDGKGYKFAVSDERVTLGEKLHIVGGCDANGVIKLWINGKLQRQFSRMLGEHKKSEYGIMIGADPGGQGVPEHLIKSKFDSIHIAASSPSHGDEFEPTNRLEGGPSTVALYQFDQVHPNVVVDTSNNQNHGIPMGPVEWVETTEMRLAAN